MKLEENDNIERMPYEHYLAEFQAMDPVEISKRCNIPYDEEKQEFTVRLMDHKYKVKFPEYTITNMEEDGTFHALTEINASEILLLRYMINGKYVEPSGEKKAYRDMPWGEVYFQQFNGRCIMRFTYGFGYKMDKFAEVMEKLGCKKVSMGDVAYEMEFMDNLFIYFILWGPDDEFPPSAQILFSDNFPESFAAEDMAHIGDITITTMKKLM